MLRDGILDHWIDFGFWAILQLDMREEFSLDRADEVMMLHKEREERLEAFKREEHMQVEEMEKAGKTGAEINAYTRTRDAERYRLVQEWRSLD